MEKKELYLKTAFCCMACDGDIAAEEMAKIKSMEYFKDIDDLEQKLNEYLAQLKEQGGQFLKCYLNELKTTQLTETEECELVSIAIQTIEVDKVIEYNEVAFFKKIRRCLKSSDDTLLSVIQENPEVADQISPEEYLMPDIIDESDFTLWDDTFLNITIADSTSPAASESIE